MSPTLIPHFLLTGPASILNTARKHELIFSALLGILFLTCVALYRLIIYPYFFSPLRSVPGPPLGHLIFGQYPTIIKGEAGIPQRGWVKGFGPVVRAVGPFGVERLIFTRPEALQKILSSDWIDYPRPKFMRDVLSLITGNGLLTVTGNEHKQMRRAMNPAFSVPNLIVQSDMYYDAIDRLLEAMDSHLRSEGSSEEGTVLHMYEWMSKATLDIICETAFGYEANTLRNSRNPLSEAYEELINLQTGPNVTRFIAVVLIPGMTRFVASDWAYKVHRWIARIPTLASLAVLIQSMNTIKKISASMLEEKLRDTSIAISDIDAKKDIMSILVRARKAEMDKDTTAYAMSDQAMMDQVLTFLAAGHETTASGLAWTLWLLAKDTISQCRLREEVAGIFSDNSRPGYRALKDLQWLDCVIMESLRVMPPVPMTFRQAAKTDHIDGVLVPKGTLLYIPIRVVNTWKEIWGDDAEEFKPERWLNLPKDYHPSLSMLSFITGPHACIGKTMAIMEMKTILASLIANYEFSPAYDEQIPLPTAAITMKPKDGMPLRVKRVPTRDFVHCQ
ncbi:hypothetical protein AX17_001780 [Amanita inopinata Kibby_2008]|nr:hypothetical protein AX17_001780 [Amanita inopinata Kibby_2008]